jgi:hypothetical protein
VNYYGPSMYSLSLKIANALDWYIFFGVVLMNCILALFHFCTEILSFEGRAWCKR